ncbi:hypothetical protein KGZ13_31215 [Pseudomonas aeruginosa]|nr:hypothetical protein [Pseudomonas aeruginosa]
MNKDEAEQRTREGLADVDAGRVVDHQLVEDWAASLLADVGVWGAMEPKTNVSSESHRKGAFRSPAHPPGITL